MKRSRSIRLVLLGTVGTVALSGCGGSGASGETAVYQNEAQCAQENDAAACREALAAARATHAVTAPAFTSREACEQKFGADNCATAENPPSAQQLADGEGPQANASQSGGFFMPMLIGYAMGSMIGGRRGAMPVWRDNRNMAFVGGRAVGKMDPASFGRGAPMRVTRGGFGSSAFGSSAG